MAKKENRKAGIAFILLHILLMIYSLGGIFSKKAAGEFFLSLRFCLYYGGVIVLLAVYAFVWQQLIKRIPLTVAYANKAVTLVWGLVWGWLFFGESITPGKIIGIIMVMAGVVIYSVADDKEMQNE